MRLAEMARQIKVHLRTDVMMAVVLVLLRLLLLMLGWKRQAGWGKKRQGRQNGREGR